MWQVTFDGERKQLTTGAGNHDADFAPVGGSFTDKYSSRMEPPVLELCAIGTNCMTFWASHAIDAFGLHAPEQLESQGARRNDAVWNAAAAGERECRGECTADCESLRRAGRANGGEPVERWVAVR